MIDDPVLVNDWHVVARATDVAESAVVSARLLDEDLVLWRRNGEVMAWRTFVHTEELVSRWVKLMREVSSARTTDGPMTRQVPASECHHDQTPNLPQRPAQRSI